MDDIKQLDDEQLASFDTEYLYGKRWQSLKQCMDQDFADQEIHILDLGGGNGAFADKILEHYPKARITILDNSKLLLDKNRPDDRKELILESIENIDSILEGRKFDLICFNWVLHHLINDSYSKTREFVFHILSVCNALLNPGGRISVFENMYDGLILHNAPGQIIFHVTKSKLLAKVARKMGANTAGVGVCFRSNKAWDTIFKHLGLQTVYYSDDDPWPVKASWRIFLHMGHVRVGHFWLGSQ